MSMDNLLAGVVREVRKTHDRESLSVDLSKGGRTLQQFADEADINNIMKRYRITGMLPQVPQTPMFGDFAQLPDYQTALNTVIAAREAFEALPSDLRTKFENDPGKYLEFATDSKNIEEMVKLGMAKVATVSEMDRLIAAIEASKSAPAPGAAPPGGGPSPS